jgi:signal peptidase I
VLAVAVLALAGLGLAMHKEVKYYDVTSGSMEPTLQIGERVAAIGSHSPKIGDIVLFHPPAGARPRDPLCGASGEGAGTNEVCDVPLPQESSSVYVKRVVAGPGDLIALVDGHVVLNGVRQDEPYIARCGPGTSCNFPTPVRVPAGDYYMLGDNRGVSDDSRYWGPVPSAWLIGTVVHCSVLNTICHAAG